MTVNTSMTIASIEHAAYSALLCGDVDEKLGQVATLKHAFDGGEIGLAQVRLEADRPGRPARPELIAPRLLQRRSTATREGHAALIHAMAHIEFNAINLALDVLCRFPGFPLAFYADWLSIAHEEATHFALLRAHLLNLGHGYGDFTAHDGLWEMAAKTAHDPLVRMALVPRVLEARGLDASPGLIRRLRAAGDKRGADILEIILRDEVGHVETGSRWFLHLCTERGLDPEATFERLLSEYDAPRAVLPLNVDARRRARFSAREIDHIETIARGRRS